jgi:DNA modification methylase
VLRDDGTLWLNLGDSYAGSWGARGRGEGTNAARPDLESKHGTAAPNRFGFAGLGIKPKDIMGIPWRVAFALQADGWYLRQDIIWSKPNPMPESVRDRCTKAHEYLFLLSKSERYYFDAKAIAEPITDSTRVRLAQIGLAEQAGSDRVPGKTNGRMKAVPPRFGGSKYGDNPDNPDHRSCGNEYVESDGSRNKRSVWSIATQPFKDAHFATFPPALVEPCILAGCPAGGLVLDPFGGAGTTGLVADRLQRDAILVELNPEYAAIARRRIAGEAPLFTEVA